MIILGIDPGPEESWWVEWSTGDQEIIRKGVFTDVDMNFPMSFEMHNVDVIVIEDIQSFGMPVGKDVFETAKVIGRFLEKAQRQRISKIIQVGRREIKLHFCNSTKAKDSNIRQAILDRFGGKEKAIGKKKSPGILYGIKKDWWSALALCIWYETQIGGKT